MMFFIIAKAVDSIFHKPDSVFVTATAREILWTGLPVDCSVKDFAGSAVCGILREDDSGFLKDGENYKFALFGAVSNYIFICIYYTYVKYHFSCMRCTVKNWE